MRDAAKTAMPMLPLLKMPRAATMSRERHTIRIRRSVCRRYMSALVLLRLRESDGGDAVTRQSATRG